MRSIWSGAIGFGLVTIPVKLYSATEESSLNLDMLDKKDQAHIRFKRVNENTGKEVEWENIIKAYDYEGKYIVLTDKDFESASPEKSKYIDIFQFVKEEEIDSIYFEKPYYVEPDKTGSRPYALLREALKKAGMAGVGSFVMRNKEHLAVIKVYENVIVLNMIRYEQEIRAYKELKIPDASEAKATELKMALELIKQMTEPFDISQYKDTYTEQLMKLIKARAKGGKPATPKLKVVHKQTEDLMEQLKASLTTKKKKAS
ncbi:MAG TPA: Ku protein [Chitinophagaceae bacterium]|jgi:DNA end-binding protein Ku